MWFLLIPFLVAIILYAMYQDKNITMPVLLLLYLILIILTVQIWKIHVLKKFNINFSVQSKEDALIDCEAE